MGNLAFYLVTVAGDLFDCEGDSSVALLICGVVGASVGHEVQAVGPKVAMGIVRA